MPDIFFNFPVFESPVHVFEEIASAKGLAAWWSLTAAGDPGLGEIYDLNFGQGCLWQAEVTIFEPTSHIEWTMIDAESDWMDTKVGFRLTDARGSDSSGEKTQVEFYHTGWHRETEHYRTSCFCWAMYLRILKRYIERGEFVAYADRLSA